MCAEKNEERSKDSPDIVHSRSNNTMAGSTTNTNARVRSLSTDKCRNYSNIPILSPLVNFEMIKQNMWQTYFFPFFFWVAKPGPNVIKSGQHYILKALITFKILLYLCKWATQEETTNYRPRHNTISSVCSLPSSPALFFQTLYSFITQETQHLPAFSTSMYIQLSMSTDLFPSCWKEAQLVPVYKKAARQ